MKKDIASRFVALLLGGAVCLAFLSANGAALSGNDPDSAGRLKFELSDVFGRKVCSADYAGVPIFLEFGACW